MQNALDNYERRKKMNKYNELFKQLVSAGLVYHNQTPKPFYRSKRVKVK